MSVFRGLAAAVAATAIAAIGFTAPGFTSSIGATASPSASTVKAFPTSAAANGIAYSTITVTINDSSFHPIAGHSVSLSQGAGSSVITAVSSTTDADGHASFKVKDLAVETVTYTAHDTTDSIDVLATVNVAFANIAYSPANSSMVASQASVVVHTTVNLTVTIKDNSNNAVSGTVSVVQDGPSTISGPAGLVGGVAMFTVRDDKAETATYYAILNSAAVVSVLVTFQPDALDHLHLAPSSATIVLGDSQSYTATGFDQYGNSRGDVTLSTTFTIAPDGSCTGTSCTSGTAGVHTVTGMDGGKSGTATLTITRVPRSGSQQSSTSTPTPRDGAGPSASRTPGPRVPSRQQGAVSPTHAAGTESPGGAMGRTRGSQNGASTGVGDVVGPGGAIFRRAASLLISARD